MTAVAPDANIATRGEQRGIRWCAFSARPARRREEAARGHGAQGSAGCPRCMSCQRARCLACEGLHRVHHHGRIVCCECWLGCEIWAASAAFGFILLLAWGALDLELLGNNLGERVPRAELCSSVEKRLRLEYDIATRHGRVLLVSYTARLESWQKTPQPISADASVPSHS